MGDHLSLSFPTHCWYKLVKHHQLVYVTNQRFLLLGGGTDLPGRDLNNSTTPLLGLSLMLQNSFFEEGDGSQSLGQMTTCNFPSLNRATLEAAEQTHIQML